MSFVILDISKVNDQKVFAGTEEQARALAEALNATSYSAYMRRDKLDWPQQFEVAEVIDSSAPESSASDATSQSPGPR